MLGFETSQFVGCVVVLCGNGVREDVDATANRVVHTDSVLRVGEDRLALRMRDIDCCLHDSGVHVYDRLVAHECAGKELHAVEAHFQVIVSHLRGFVRRGGFGELHLGRQIDGWPFFGKMSPARRIFGPGTSPASTRRRRARELFGSEPRSQTVVKPQRVSISCMCFSRAVAGAVAAPFQAGSVKWT